VRGMKKIVSVSAEVDRGTCEEEERISVRFTIWNSFFSINYHNISVMVILKLLILQLYFT